MRAKTKSLMAWLLALAMLLSLLPLAARAAEVTTTDSLLVSETYKDSGGNDVTYTYTYDDAGNMLTKECESPIAVDGIYYTYTYDDAGNLLTETRETGGYYSTTIYTYDDVGNMLTEAYEDSGEYTYSYTYTYDNAGNMLTKAAYEQNGEYIYTCTTTYTYDDAGNMLTEAYKNSSDYTYSYTYTYDSAGNILTEVYERNGYCIYTYNYTYTYDDDGNVLTRAYESSGGTTTYTYTYDDVGNVLTVTHEIGGSGSTYTYTYTYDSAGNMLTEAYRSSYGATHTTTYTYDDVGNVLIIAYESEGDERGAYTSTRTYTYIYTEVTDTISLFNDVQDTSQYYYDAVYWAYDLGITKGTSDTAFSPNGDCTRAQFATFLYRLAQASGEDVSCGLGSSPFDDVIEGVTYSEYYVAILWAYDKGITTGTSKTTFDPDDTITRAQAVTMLYRYEKMVNGEPSVSGSSPFSDVIEGVTYSDYYTAILWACDLGITNGNSDGGNRFDINVTCSRAMMVTFLHRYAG